MQYLFCVIMEYSILFTFFAEFSLPRSFELLFSTLCSKVCSKKKYSVRYHSEYIKFVKFRTTSRNRCG